MLATTAKTRFLVPFMLLTHQVSADCRCGRREQVMRTGLDLHVYRGLASGLDKRRTIAVR